MAEKSKQLLLAKYVPGEPEVENSKYVVQVNGNVKVNA